MLNGRAGFTLDDFIAGPHSRVWQWYAGTSDTSALEFADSPIFRRIVDQGVGIGIPAQRFNAVPWYTSGSVWEGIGQGLDHDQAGGGMSLRPDSGFAGVKTDTDNTEYDFANSQQRASAVPVVFNGDFEYGNLHTAQRFPTGFDVPGWSFHGGEMPTGGLLNIGAVNGNHYLEWNNLASEAVHNRFYVPTDVTRLTFDMMVNDGSSNDALTFFFEPEALGAAPATRIQIGTLAIPQAATTSFLTVRFRACRHRRHDRQIVRAAQRAARPGQPVAQLHRQHDLAGPHRAGMDLFQDTSAAQYDGTIFFSDVAGNTAHTLTLVNKSTQAMTVNVTSKANDFLVLNPGKGRRCSTTTRTRPSSTRRRWPPAQA